MEYLEKKRESKLKFPTSNIYVGTIDTSRTRSRGGVYDKLGNYNMVSYRKQYPEENYISINEMSKQSL